MRRPLFLLLVTLAAGVAIFAGAFYACQYTCRCYQAQPADELAWLRLEFHLNDAEMARIRRLHEGYRPKCEAICAQIAAKKSAATKGPSVSELRSR